MFDVGGGELLLILLAIIILFGPKKLPELTRMIGKGVQNIRKAQAQFQEQIREIERDINLSEEAKKFTVKRTNSNNSHDNR